MSTNRQQQHSNNFRKYKTKFELNVKYTKKKKRNRINSNEFISEEEEEGDNNNDDDDDK